MNDISVYLGRQRGEGSPIEKLSLRPYLVVSAPSAGVSNVCEVKNVPLLVQNEEHMHECVLSIRDPHLPRQVKCHSCDKMDQAFPFCFCILQAIKNWTVGRPGTRLS